jgi:hypothetical protein
MYDLLDYFVAAYARRLRMNVDPVAVSTPTAEITDDGAQRGEAAALADGERKRTPSSSTYGGALEKQSNARRRLSLNQKRHNGASSVAAAKTTSESASAHEPPFQGSLDIKRYRYNSESMHEAVPLPVTANPQQIEASGV